MNKLEEVLELKSLDDEQRQWVIDKINGLFEASADKMRRHHRKWYLSDRFLDGDHWLVYNRLSNSIQPLPINNGEIRRSIDSIGTQLRAIKNFITRNILRMQIQPKNIQALSNDEIKKACEDGQTLMQYFYTTRQLKMLQGDIVDEALRHNIGYFMIGLNDVDGNGVPDLTIEVKSSYDIYPSPEATDITVSKCRYVFAIGKEYIDDIKGNNDYNLLSKENPKLEAETSENISEYKAKLDRDRESKQPKTNKDLESATVKDLYFRYRDESGAFKVGQISTCGSEVLRVKKLNTKDYCLVPYRTDRKVDQLIGKAWLENILSPNKALDKMCSHIETYVLRMLNGKILVKQGTQVNRITDKQGEIIRWKGGSAPDQWSLQPLPSTPFEYMKYLLRFIEDTGGAHPSTLGALPAANQSGKSIEALQAADANNIADPIKNLSYTMTQLTYRILDLLSANTLTEATVSMIVGGKKKSVSFIGAKPIQESPEAKVLYGGKKTFIIDENVVDVEMVPDLAYTEAGRYDKLLELAQAKLIPTTLLLEELKFSNVGDIIRKLQEEQRIAGAANSKEKSQINPIELANQENQTLINGQDVQPTPPELRIPEHTQLHEIFLQEQQTQGKTEEQLMLLMQHLNNEKSNL